MNIPFIPTAEEIRRYGLPLNPPAVRCQPPEADAATEDESSPVSPNSPGGCTREHPIPEDSILADYRDFMHGFSELPDGLILAPILALCGKLLTPHVTLDFGGSKPLTIYNFIATPAGLRKSTTFKPV